MKQPAKILVVDDEPDLELLIRQRFRHKIKNNEFSFDFAGNGIIALEKLSDKTNDYDMILTDINMPEMDGLTLLVRIKEQFKHQKAVVVSAYGDLENIRTAMNRGAFDFITKPIDFSDLETTIEKTLEENQLIRQGQEAQEKLNYTLLEMEIAELQRSKAEQSEKFKQQFLANMSHEIRTPLNSIIGLTNLLVKGQLDDLQKKYLNIIRKSSQNLLVIINDILDLSKIEAGKMELENIPFSLAECIEMVFQTLLHKAEEKNLKFKIQIESSVPEIIFGDPVRLGQILMNLTSNAIKFTESGYVMIEVKELSRIKNNAIIEFSVVDSGVGIPGDKIDHIFESFSQASSDTTRKFGGTGLGLTISRQLIELQKGNIYVHSQPGRGTTFSFRIPYDVGQKSDLSKTESTEHNVDGDELNGTRILVVEDNPFNQMVAVDTLKDLIKEVSVEVAENGIDALKKFKAGDFDVILMDIQMPEMDGFETCKRIRSDFPSPKNTIPIMAMTANVTQDEVENCFECGMTEYISKPFDPQDLLNKMGKIILKK